MTWIKTGLKALAGDIITAIFVGIMWFVVLAANLTIQRPAILMLTGLIVLIFNFIIKGAVLNTLWGWK